MGQNTSKFRGCIELIELIKPFEHIELFNL